MQQNKFQFHSLLIRSGLVNARLAGAEHATGDILVFLDAHCECTSGWLQPLVQRIQKSKRSVVVPLIDVINPKTLEYQTDGYGFDVILLLLINFINRD